MGILGTAYSYAQINVQSSPNSTINNQNPFLDASGYINKNNSIAKGLVFPRTDLTQFVFNTSLLGNYQNFPTAFDGMIVYNTGEGTVNANGTESATKGKKVDVKPGFYYFSNPSATVATKNVSEGIWVRIGDGSANAKLSIAEGTAVETNTSIDTKSIFTIKGSFTNTTGNNFTITKPDGFTKLHSIKMYKKNTTGSTNLVGTDLYSYELVESDSKLKMVFGNGIISIAYPEGDYEYVLEYFK